MNESIEVNVTPHTNGNIVVSTELVKKESGMSQEIRKTIERRVLQTQDEQVQKGLIALGWTPPDGESPVVADAAMLVDAIIGKGFASDDQRLAAFKAGYVIVNPPDGINTFFESFIWNREALSLLSVRKLLGIYTDGSFNG